MNNIDKYFSDDAPLWLKQTITEAILQGQKDQANERCADESPLEEVSKSDEHESPTKPKLLAKYLDKPVTKFKQYDCFIDAGPDCVFQPDKDGDFLFGENTTHELMHGTSVRVLIRPDESKQDVVRVLLKIAEQISCSDDFKNVTVTDDKDCPF